MRNKPCNADGVLVMAAVGGNPPELLLAVPTVGGVEI